MAEENANVEKKIIVDEDWKSQVEAEREALRQSPQSSSPAAEPASEQPLPPPSLSLLANSLYLQAAIALGLLPNPLTGKAQTQLPQAKHTIDMLAILQQKTEGNRTPEESEDIEEMLHQLRLAFLSVQEQAAGAK